MSLRTDLIGVVDDARSIVADLGLRARTVTVRTITRGATGLASLTTAPTVDDLVLEPTPRVRGEPSKYSRKAGLWKQGDVLVDRISASYERSDLDPGGDSVWLVDGAEYRLVSLAGPEQGQQWEWVALLRPVGHAGAASEV